MDSPSRDVRGVKRGKCRMCSDCIGYQRSMGEGGSKCLICNCLPGKHLKATTSMQDDQSQSLRVAAGISNLSLQDKATDTTPKCHHCSEKAYFDLNTRIQYQCCRSHQHLSYIQDSDGAQAGHAQSSGIVVAPPIVTSQAIASQASAAGDKDPSLCAIEGCDEPKFVDVNGQVHDCCGYTHAMELLRRKAMQGTNQKIVKGITHCLLPQCNNVTWPFMNYCSRTHAEEGKKLRLKSPQGTGDDTTRSKDASLCLLLGCCKPKCQNLKKGSFFDYCGKTHAHEAKERKLIVPGDGSGPKLDSMCRFDGCREPRKRRSDGKSFHDYCCLNHATAAASNASTSSIPKEDTMCIIPECTRPKYIDPNTKTTREYCGRTHAQEGQDRGIQPVLTSHDKVDAFLKQFSSTLQVVCIKENDHAKPGGALYKTFVAARDSLPVSDRKTCLAFHGTEEQNIDNICANGFDTSRRGVSNGQSYGKGEYFATTPSIPLGYTQGGKKMLLNELLLGQNGVHHNKHGEIIVMKDPAHELPRFIITFQ